MALPVIHREPILDRRAFEEFSCDVPHENPPTPDELPPDAETIRQFQSVALHLPDGETVEMWVFQEPGEPRQFPGQTIRVQEEKVLHSSFKSAKNTHTIHHHGIEPTSFNDGVGHTSFEVTGEYTYQMEAFEPGTFFWHCHKNTVLHFEMGLYGFMIVDPPTGEGTVFRGSDVVSYDLEALWAFDEIDPSWHHKNHDAGLHCLFGEDAGLHDFNPKYFLITGVAHPQTRTDPRIVANIAPGHTMVARVLNAGYTIQRHTFGLDVEVIEIDGRTLGKPPRAQYSRPFTIPAGTPFELTSAQRWALLIRPTQPGTFPVRTEFQHWITRDVLGITETFINVGHGAEIAIRTQPQRGGVEMGELPQQDQQG